MIDVAKIRGRMAELKITNEKLARELKLSVGKLRGKLEGWSVMTLDEAEKIAEVLEISDERFGEYFFKDCEIPRSSCVQRKAPACSRKNRVYPNLYAEQKKRGFTNADVAAAIGMHPATYGVKCRNGRFRVSEARALCQLFNADFNYLFEPADSGGTVAQ